MLQKALDCGVNYFDTATFYCYTDSQKALGEFFEGEKRKRIILSTKNPHYSENADEWHKNLDTSLERLRTDYIDIYNHHGMGWESYCKFVEPFLSKLMMKAKEEGKVRHICCSFHDTPENLIKIVNTGYPDVITLQYNLLDQRLAEGIALAHSKGIGIVVMGPVGGGRLGAQSDVMEQLAPGVKRVPELAMRFVLSNPGVSIALSGMSTMEQVEENVRVCSDSRTFTTEELRMLDEHTKRLKAMEDLYCSGCGYCKPCSQNVDISHIFQTYNQGRVYGFWDHAKRVYQYITKEGKGADRCIECGLCEPKCPQKIKIPEELKKAAERLGKEG